MSKQPLIGHFEPPHGTVRAYTLGFLSCVAITLIAYGVAVNHTISDRTAIGLVALLAAVQCAVQLRVFLHLGQEFAPRWKLAAFGLMLTVVVIVVAGSLWIMDNLNYRMMQSPAQAQQYIDSQDGL